MVFFFSQPTLSPRRAFQADPQREEAAGRSAGVPVGAPVR